MEKLARLQGRAHVWFVGAYSRYSMPLLENGVKSALEVAKALGVDVSDVEFDEASWAPPPSSPTACTARAWRAWPAPCAAFRSSSAR